MKTSFGVAIQPFGLIFLPASPKVGWYFFIILMAFLAINSFMVSRQPNIVQIDYNQFKQLVENRTIKRVNIETERYVGYSFSLGQLATDGIIPDGGAQAFATYKVLTFGLKKSKIR